MIDLKKCVLDCGADKAGQIKTSELVFDKSLRKSCEANFCGHYKKSYACPPYIGKAQALIEKIKKYENAVIFQTISEIKNSYDVEGMAEAERRHKEITKKVMERIRGELGDFLILATGGCDNCKDCAVKTNEPCRFPDKVIGSISAYCINVSAAAGKAGMKYINGENTVTYFSVICY